MLLRSTVSWSDNTRQQRNTRPSLNLATCLGYGTFTIAVIAWKSSYQKPLSLAIPVQASVIVFGAVGLTTLLLSACIRLRTHEFSGVYQDVPASPSSSSPDRDHFTKEEYDDVELLQTASHFTWRSNMKIYLTRLVTKRYLITMKNRTNANILLAALAIVARVEMFRWKSWDPQCSTWDVEILLPLVVVLFDHFSTSGISRSDDRVQRMIWILSPVGLLTLASAVQAIFIPLPRSTYICANVTHGAWMVPASQILSLVLDFGILRAFEMFLRPSRLQGSIATSFASTSFTFLLSSLILLVCGIIALVIRDEESFTLRLDQGCSESLLWCFLFLTTAVIAAAFIIKQSGLASLVVGLGYIIISTFTWDLATSKYALLEQPSFPTAIAFSYAMVFGLASFAFTHWRDTLEVESQHNVIQLNTSRAGRYLVFLGVCSLMIIYGVFANPITVEVGSHPIEGLMKEASARAQQWAQEASTSRSLTESVNEYKRRYRRHPPPSFDAWYKYATERNSLIIDDFDTLMNDLEPFWAFKPAELRRRMHDAVENDKWIEILTIRQSQVESRPGKEHRWMAETLKNMLERFSEHLPDMEFAFNLNDEPRTIVSFEAMQTLRQEAGRGLALMSSLTSSGNVRNEWSQNRASNLDRSEPGLSHPCQDIARRHTFSVYTAHCPPDSPARTQRTWDPHELCISCYEPHSIGPFVSNWPLSRDSCHQPDLQFLHGGYHPAVRLIYNDLVPIFSQSKLSGFADILMPSPFNYADGATYNEDVGDAKATSYAQKKSTMFWRGATSEGWSEYGTWKGYVRQRVTHMTNSSNWPSLRATMPIHLPTASENGTEWTSTMLTAKILEELNLSFDVAFTDIVKASESNERIQKAEFLEAPKVEFETHWKYRYLFDGDGSAFSGRFLAFLQSKSTPFKAGLHKVWWDGRLTAWKHFVPVDVRLHGLYDTLLYFMGASSKGKDNILPAVRGNVEAGEDIAMCGREWAQRVLRKEDMEIYTFRLLLEWARLTDDARDEIGFTL